MRYPIKVMIVNHSARLGGAERVLSVFLENVDRSRIHPILVAPEGPLSVQAESLDVQWVPFDAAKEITTTRNGLTLRDAVKTADALKELHSVTNRLMPHVIMSNSVKAHVLCSWVAGRRFPHVVRLHDNLSTFSRGARALLSSALRRATLISCVSESVAKDVRRWCRVHERVEVCYNGYKQPNINVRRHLSGNHVVTAGWLFPWKGFHVFIEAMELVAQEIDDWTFTIAGGVASDVSESRNYEGYLRKMIESSRMRERFSLMGEYNSLTDYLCCPEHCIFVLPSQRPDPLPTVLLEAALLGVPVVATRVGGVTEIVPDSSHGLICGPTATDIAKRVKEAIDNPEERFRIAEKLHERTASHFNVETYVRTLADQLIRASA